MTPRPWYRMEVAADPAVADLYVFDIIGDWIDDLWGFDSVTTAKSFKDQLDKLQDVVTTIRLHVNSPGGDVFGALAIANMLRDQRTSKGRRVETSIEGLAASAASIIIQAGDPIRMGDNALVMVHNPLTFAWGNAAEFRKIAGELDTIRDAIAATYRWHSPLSADEIVALMDATTWMDADEAIAKGFATEKVDGLKAAASLEPRALAKLVIPDKYRARVEALLKPAPPTPTPAAAVDVLRLCREGECLDLAEELITAQATLEAVQVRVTSEKTARAQAEARAREIRGVCATAKLPELADGYIKGAMAPADVRAHVTTLTAKLDRAEIDGGLEPDRGTKRQAVIDTAAIYATRNQLPTKKE